MNNEEETKMTKLVKEKKSAREFQERKHSDWNENYELYRNKIKTNRLTQRQAINIPLMKETIKTQLSKVDDAPDVLWGEKSGDQVKEVIYNQIWEDNFKRNALELLDVVDKKNVFFYGISTKKLNISKDGVDISLLDTFDVVYDPLTNPMDVESARYIIHQNIFKPLRDVLADDRYTQSGKDKLKEWIASDQGIIQSGKNKEAYEKKIERIKSMGLSNENFAIFSGGDVIVNITEHFTNMWNPTRKEFERRVITYANDTLELADDLLEDLIGVKFWPFEFWGEDPEPTDIYADSLADLIRPLNKVINVWFSQQIENRTLQNFQMHWFDSTQEGYEPQTYEPGPGRMLPAPGDPSKTIMPVQINGLDETMNAINFVTNMVERASGATAIEKGQSETGVQTLGEIEILTGKSSERAKTMAKFYKASWYKTAKKWDAMMQANDFDDMKLYKTGSDGKMYEKVVTDKDWKSEAGYEPVVASSSEQEADEIKSIQKFGAVMAQFPNNLSLRKIMQQRQLKMLDLSPQELKEVKDEEEKLKTQSEMAMMAGNVPEEQSPDTQALSNSINQSVQALGQ